MSDNERLIVAVLLMLAWLLLCVHSWLRGRQSKKLPAPGHSHTTLIAYASQSGAAEKLAQDYWQLLGGATAAQLLPLNQVTDELLSTSRRALLVASTYGEGEPPDNAAGFARRLNRVLDSDDNRGLKFKDLEFCVVALGDSAYQRFCAFGHHLHDSLLKLGAQALHLPVEIDRQQSDDHSRALTPKLLKWLGSDSGINIEIAHKTKSATVTKWHLRKRELLNPSTPGQPLYRLHLQANRATPHWRAGDILQIHPRHSAKTVNVWLRMSGLEGMPWWQCSESQLVFTEQLTNRQLPLPCTSLPTSPEQFIGWARQLPLLPMREYSIASVPREGEIQLLVRQQKNEHGELGVGSGWLTAIAECGSPIEARIRSNPGFHCNQPKRPLLLIGSGSGLAGLRGHLAERAGNSDAGKIWMIFGERSATADRLLEPELQQWKTRGVLMRLDRAFSRIINDDDHKVTCRYVQDVLRAEAGNVKKWLDEDGMIYVCGRLKGMGEGVHSVLQEILGENKVGQLLEAGVYRRDLY